MPQGFFPNQRKNKPKKGDITVNRIIALVRWLCRQLSLTELLTAANIIIEVLNDDRPDIKCKDYFSTKYPNYRKFNVDPNPPLTEIPPSKKKLPSVDWKELIKSYRQQNGKELKLVKRRDNSTSVLNSIRCPNCNAPENISITTMVKNVSNCGAKYALSSFRPIDITAPQKLSTGALIVTMPFTSGKNQRPQLSISALTINALGI